MVDRPSLGEAGERAFSRVPNPPNLRPPAAPKEGPILYEDPNPETPQAFQSERTDFPVLEFLKDKLGPYEGAESTAPKSIFLDNADVYRMRPSLLDVREPPAPSQHELDALAAMVDMVIDRDVMASLAFDSQPRDEFPRAGTATSPRRTVPPRVLDKPKIEEWADDELMTLPEAAHLFWPSGPLTTHSLRTAGRTGALAITVVAGKHFTTPAAIRRMGAANASPTEATVRIEDRAEAALKRKIAEAQRLGGGRPRSRRGAERPVAPIAHGDQGGR